MKTIALRLFTVITRRMHSVIVSAYKKNDTNNPRTSNIERIALLLDYEMRYGGYVYPVYNPYVFFKNDTIVKEPNVPIDEKHSINGYTLTLHFNNGVSKRISFAFMVTIKKVFRITERTYTKD